MNPNVDVFDRDAENNGGYLYTTYNQLRSQMTTKRTMKAILAADGFAGRSELDIGCGDGFNTIQLWDSGFPCQLTGIDAAEQAIKVANANEQQRPIEFVTDNAHRLLGRKITLIWL